MVGFHVYACAFMAAHVLAWDHSSATDLAEALAGGEAVLVAFVLPNEAKSHYLEPEWQTAVSGVHVPRHLRQEQQQFRFLSIDCEAERPACENTHRLTSFPSIRLFRPGEELSLEYHGPRRAAAITHFPNRHLRPAVSSLSSPDTLATFKALDEVVFIAFPGPDAAASARLQAALARAAERHRGEFTFGVVTDPTLAKAQGFGDLPVVVCYLPVDAERVVFVPEREGIQLHDDHEQDGDGIGLLDQKLEAWLRKASRGVVEELTVLNRDRLVEPGNPIAYIFALTEPGRQEVRKAVYPFAQSHFHSVTTVTAYPLDFPGLMARLGLDPKGPFPAVSLHHLASDLVYPYPQTGRPPNARALRPWVADVLEGRVEPWNGPMRGREDEGEQGEEKKEKGVRGGGVEGGDGHDTTHSTIVGAGATDGPVGGRQRDEL